MHTLVNTLELHLRPERLRRRLCEFTPGRKLRPYRRASILKTQSSIPNLTTHKLTCRYQDLAPHVVRQPVRPLGRDDGRRELRDVPQLARTCACPRWE